MVWALLRVIICGNTDPFSTTNRCQATPCLPSSFRSSKYNLCVLTSSHFLVITQISISCRISRNITMRLRFCFIVYKPGFPFWTPDSIQYIPSRDPLVLQVAFFPPGAVLGSANRGCRPARKIQNREILSFQCISQIPLLPSCPGHPDFWRVARRSFTTALSQNRT